MSLGPQTLSSTAGMDQVDQFNSSRTHNNNKQVCSSRNNDGNKQLGVEEKKAAVNDEMRRLNQLPSNSTYVVHRSRVLSKIMQLLSVQRTTSQDEELELLFAGLSL